MYGILRSTATRKEYFAEPCKAGCGPMSKAQSMNLSTDVKQVSTAGQNNTGLIIEPGLLT